MIDRLDSLEYSQTYREHRDCGCAVVAAPAPIMFAAHRSTCVDAVLDAVVAARTLILSATGPFTCTVVRVVNRGATRFSARVVNRGATRTSARVVNRGATRTSARVVNRGATRTAARVVNRGGIRTSARVVNRGTTRTAARVVGSRRYPYR